MKHFPLPRMDVADLTAFFRARAIDRMRRRADQTASLERGLARDNAQRHQLDRAATSTSCWILHAR